MAKPIGAGAFAIFGLALVAAGVEAGLISYHYVSFAENFVWFIGAIAVSMLYFYRYGFQQSNDARLLTLGIAYVALGTAVNHGIYAIWQIALGFGIDTQQIIELQNLYAPYISLVPTIVVLTGYVYHTQPLWVETWGEQWPWRMVIAITVVFMSLVAIAAGIGVVWHAGP